MSRISVDDDFDDFDDLADFDAEALEADQLNDCSIGPDGFCGQAGSEYCEFECPFR